MMIRMKIYLPVACLLGLVAGATHAWTQESPVREGETRQTPSVDGVRREAPVPGAPGSRALPGSKDAARDVRGADNGDVRNPGRDGQGPMRPRAVSRTVNEIIYQPVSPEELAEIRAFQDAKQALKDARNEAERKTASEAIQLQLDKQFQRDLAQREQDLAAVEERVKVLREQLSRRKNSKDEIVALRLKTILNNADGLGFPGDEGLEDRPSYAPATVRQPPIGLRGAVPSGPPGEGRGGDPNESNKRARGRDNAAPGDGFREPENVPQPR